MHHNVLDDDDRVVDDEADGGGEAAECHQVEALAERAQHDERDGECRGNDHAGDERRATVAQEQHHDQRREDQADDDGIAHAGDRIVHQVRLIVEGLQHHALRQLFSDGVDF